MNPSPLSSTLCTLSKPTCMPVIFFGAAMWKITRKSMLSAVGFVKITCHDGACAVPRSVPLAAQPESKLSDGQPSHASNPVSSCLENVRIIWAS